MRYILTTIVPFVIITRRYATMIIHHLGNFEARPARHLKSKMAAA